MNNKDIEKAVIRSQHCQRNWDLSKQIPEDDKNTILHSAINCPSKQNVSFYNLHVITNRKIIEDIYEQTDGFLIENNVEKNTQVLANMLIVYTKNLNSEIQNWKRKNLDETTETQLRDLHMATGISAGYVNLTSSLLGYSTGCCLCFNEEKVREILGVKEEVALIMGIGFKNKDKNRRVHHLDNNKVFEIHKKEQISISHIN